MSGRTSRRRRAESRRLLDRVLEVARRVRATTEIGDGCAVFLPDGSTHLLHMTVDGPVLQAATDADVHLDLLPSRGEA